MKKTNLAFTVTGIRHYQGPFPFEKGMLVKCVKEPKNKYDKEAIRVKLPHLDKVGYIANSSYTVEHGTISAGRLYDQVGKKFYGRVLYIMPDKVICEVVEGKKSKMKKKYKEEE